MKKELVVVDRSEFATLSDDLLMKRLQDWQGDFIKLLPLGANLVAEADRRGLEIDFLPSRLLIALRRVADGQMLPAVAQRYWERPDLRDKIGRLSIKDQTHFINGGGVKVMTPDNTPTGEVYHERQFPPESLTPKQIRQVFCDHVRTESEQIAWLKDMAQRDKERADNPHKPSLRVDNRKRGVRVGDWVYSREEIEEVLSLLG